MSPNGYTRYAANNNLTQVYVFFEIFFHDSFVVAAAGTSLQSFQDSFSSLKTQYSYVKDWYRYRGESLADYAVRLYTSNVDIHVPHIENCNRLLRIIIQFITLRIIHKNNQRLTVRHLMKMKWFLGVMMLCVPEKTLQEDVQEMMGWKDTSCTEEDELGRKVYPQMNKNIKFHILRFVESIEVMKYGDNYLADDELLEETVVNGFLSDVMKSPSISLSSYSTSNLFLLLHTLASDVLTAHVLPIEVRKRVKRLVMDFRSNCWFWHSPMKAANEFLRPLVKNFLYWLRCNMESLQLACANESVLYCVRYDLRCMLKCQVYESFQHFMDVFQSVKDGLTNIELPSNAIHLLQLAKEVGGLEDANHVLSTQILKDLNRDCIMLNGIRLSANEAITALKILIANAQFKEPLIDWDDTEEMLYLSKCTWHVLHAASRTVCSGDSYLIVSDLFGGEGVSVNAPSHLPPTPICIQTQGLMFEVAFFLLL